MWGAAQAERGDMALGVARPRPMEERARGANRGDSTILKPGPSTRTGDAREERATPVLWRAARKLRRTLGDLRNDMRGLCEPEVYVSSTRPAQGDTVAVFVSYGKPRTPIGLAQNALSEWTEGLVRITFDGENIPAYPVRRRRLGRPPARTYRALIPVTPLDEPGSRTLVVQVNDGRYRRAPVHVPCVIQARPFLTQHVWLGEAKRGNLSPSAVESARVESWRQRRSPRQLWRGPLSIPSAGEITTHYGQKRFYNGRFAENYYHRGIDYAAERGAPVRSPANGKVVLVGRESHGFRLHGNCLGLDHGQGVASLMLHLDEIAPGMRPGAHVKKDQVIGTVGNTGCSTGPHLHWGLFVNGKSVDPAPWMQRAASGEGANPRRLLW